MKLIEKVTVTFKSDTVCFWSDIVSLQRDVRRQMSDFPFYFLLKKINLVIGNFFGWKSKSVPDTKLLIFRQTVPLILYM